MGPELYESLLWPKFADPELEELFIHNYQARWSRMDFPLNAVGALFFGSLLIRMQLKKADSELNWRLLQHEGGSDLDQWKWAHVWVLGKIAVFMAGATFQAQPALRNWYKRNRRWFLVVLDVVCWSLDLLYFQTRDDDFAYLHFRNFVCPLGAALGRCGIVRHVLLTRLYATVSTLVFTFLYRDLLFFLASLPNVFLFHGFALVVAYRIDLSAREEFLRSRLLAQEEGSQWTGTSFSNNLIAPVEDTGEDYFHGRHTGETSEENNDSERHTVQMAQGGERFSDEREFGIEDEEGDARNGSSPSGVLMVTTGVQVPDQGSWMESTSSEDVAHGAEATWQELGGSWGERAGVDDDEASSFGDSPSPSCCNFETVQSSGYGLFKRR